ncbi:hypothetical protein JCM24511_02094 [Saitozyma sp. JCM 24511]|nr:hypothetical protein JCM24511_02094 [Saitozyma sp. JCM 24511]
MSEHQLVKTFGDIPKLTGKENFVEWDQRLKLSLLIVKGSQFIEPNASPPSDGSQSAAWLERDEKDSAPHIGRASAVYHALKKTYGTSNAQYMFALGRRFIENRVHGEDSVGNWVNQVKAQHRELKSLKFDLDALCVNVLLNGLPDRFSSYVDNVWTNVDNKDNDHDDDEDNTDNGKQSGKSKSKAEIAAMALVNDAVTHYTDNNDSVEHLL